MAARIRQIDLWLRRQFPAQNWRAFWLKELPVVIALAIALPMPSYYQQADAFNYFHELWLVWGIFGLVGGSLAALYHLSLGSSAIRILAALPVFYALMMDFDKRSVASPGLVGVFLPGSQKLVVFGLLIFTGWLFGKLAERLMHRYYTGKGRQLVIMLWLLVGGILLTNGLFLTQYLVKHRSVVAYQPETNQLPPRLSPNDTQPRDVYYLVFDRYASRHTLKDHYSFDNSPFLDHLSSLGFTIRDQAYSNYQFTAPSIASTLRMDYHTDIQHDLGDSVVESYLPYRRILEDSPVSQLFRSAGYQVTRLSSWYGVTRVDNQGETVDPQFELTILGAKFPLSDLQSSILDRTFVAPWLRSGMQLGTLQIARLNTPDTGQLVLDQLDYLRQAAAQPHDQPKFIFAHILSPHPQYVFTGDGTKPTYNPDDDNIGAPRELKYINQLKFLNSQIDRTVTTILQSSRVPPIIIIQSDEGPYPPEFHDYSRYETGDYPWSKVSTETLKYKYGILAAYYLPDIPEDQKSQLNSPVNAFRFVFNHYFGANMPYLPDCALLFEGAQPYSFYDATAKIRGAENSGCAAYAQKGSLN